jgi:heptaprenyl diphosphate synthase
MKVAGQGIITGSLFSYIFLFSFAGTASSAFVMYVLRKLCPRSAGKSSLIGFAGIGMAGALVSNAAQLILARLFIFGAGVRYLTPPFLLSAIVCGGALGIFCEFFAARSRWYSSFSKPVEAAVTTAAVYEKSAAVTSVPAMDKRQLRREAWDRLFNPKLLCICGIILTLTFLFIPNLKWRVGMFVFFVIFAWLSGKHIRPLVTLSVMAGIIAFNLLVPYGRLIAEWGPLQITAGSLRGGLNRAVILEGLIMLSGACIRPGLLLPGSFGKLLSDSFRILAAIQERHNSIRRFHVIEGIDELLMELSGTDSADSPSAKTDTHANV